MDDWKKQITESIAEPCVSSFIESTFPGCTISNLKFRVTLIGDERSESYKPNPSRSKLEDEGKPPLVLTKEFSGLQARQPRRLRKDVAAERGNRFALWRAAWRNLWRDACW